MDRKKTQRGLTCLNANGAEPLQWTLMLHISKSYSVVSWERWFLQQAAFLIQGKQVQSWFWVSFSYHRLKREAVNGHGHGGGSSPQCSLKPECDPLLLLPLCVQVCDVAAQRYTFQAALASIFRMKSSLWSDTELLSVYFLSSDLHFYLPRKWYQIRTSC